MITRSERLFEEYCLSRGYRCERIPISHGGRFPDYLIRTRLERSYVKSSSSTRMRMISLSIRTSSITVKQLPNESSANASEQQLSMQRVSWRDLKGKQDRALRCCSTTHTHTILLRRILTQLCSVNPQSCLGRTRMDVMLARWLRMAATES